MKIVYCLNSIRYTGGIQRVTIVKANTLAELPENEVYIIVTDNKNGVLVHPLSQKVRLIDLDVTYYQDVWISRRYVLKGIVVKRREHKRKLAEALRRIQPDIVVSVGQSEKYILPAIHGKWAKVRELHFEKNYRKRLVSSLRGKLSAMLSDYYDYHCKIKKYDRIVVLTEEDKEGNWKGYENVSVIPNPLSFVEGRGKSTLENKMVVSAGRLSAQKNYASLIRAFRKVADRHSDWTLEVLGDGEERKQLETLIGRLNLNNNVFLKGYTSDIESEMLKASCFALSSIFEGFPLVITEAMQLGLPVVSYACPCGPKDIITEGVDGFLVSVNGEDAMADRICRLIEDKDLRNKMGKAAKDKAKQYSVDNIVSLWMEEFVELKGRR